MHFYPIPKKLGNKKNKIRDWSFWESSSNFFTYFLNFIESSRLYIFTCMYVFIIISTVYMHEDFNH